jgi:GDPmannose 4,6-dehydratase
MKTALITGVTGQDGPYLAKLLLEKKYKVYGMNRRTTKPNFANLEYLGIKDDVEIVNGDMTDECSLNNLIKTYKPDEVYNLAGQSFVGASWDIPKVTTEINSLGPLYLLEAIKNYSPTTRFYQASTSEMFGTNHTNGKQNENTPFKPQSPYAVSKLYAHNMVNVYRKSFGLHASSGILFNHESIFRPVEFVTRKITKGVTDIVKGKTQFITLGNLESSRDWAYAGDMVKGIWMMLQQKEADDYVLATGQTHSIRDFIREAFKNVDITDEKEYMKYIKVDPQFKRPHDVVALCGDSTKAKNILGWQPETSFEELVKMMVEADLKRNQE